MSDSSSSNTSRESTPTSQDQHSSPNSSQNEDLAISYSRSFHKTSNLNVDDNFKVRRLDRKQRLKTNLRQATRYMRAAQADALLESITFLQGDASLLQFSKHSLRQLERYCQKYGTVRLEQAGGPKVRGFEQHRARPMRFFINDTCEELDAALYEYKGSRAGDPKRILVVKQKRHCITNTFNGGKPAIIIQQEKPGKQKNNDSDFIDSWKIWKPDGSHVEAAVQRVTERTATMRNQNPTTMELSEHDSMPQSEAVFCDFSTATLEAPEATGLASSATVHETMPTITNDEQHYNSHMTEAVTGDITFLFKKCVDDPCPRIRNYVLCNDAERLFAQARVAGIASKKTLVLQIRINQQEPRAIMCNDLKDYLDIMNEIQGLDSDEDVEVTVTAED